jgi:tRNA (guanine-N7-)-methyltransferase
VRIRQHVNPLKSNFLEIDLAPLSLPEGRPVEVELGCGEAYFLMDRAAAEPERLYVGVEIRREVAWAANDECAKRGLGNVICVFANMSVDLPRLFPAGRVERFHLNFPDPYFKSAQHKRRVISPGLFETVHALLQPGGELHVATDIFDLGLEALAALEGAEPPLFVNLAGPWTYVKSSPFAARSRREHQCESENTRVWRLAFRKA